MGKPTAMLFFNPGSEAVVKSLAAKIRLSEHHCNLTNGRLFRDERDVSEHVSMIGVQVELANAKNIVAVHRRAAPEAEIHFFDETGAMCDEPDDLRGVGANPFDSLKEEQAAPAVAETPVDPEPEPDPEPDVVAEAPADDVEAEASEPAEDGQEAVTDEDSPVTQ